MKRIAFAIAMLFLFASHADADVIKPIDARATSQFGVGINVVNLVNGDQGPEVGRATAGLISAGGPGVLDDLHDHTVSEDDTKNIYSWINGCQDAGIAGASPGCEDPNDLFSTAPVNEQILEFEFDGAYDLTNAHIWQDNTDIFAPDRSLDEFVIFVSPDRTGDTFTEISTNNLTAADGDSEIPAQVISLEASSVRRVRFQINSNHNPLAEFYAGLSEVRFEGTLVGDDPDSDADKNGLSDGGDLLLWQQFLGVGEPILFGDPGDQITLELYSTQSLGDFTNNNVTRADDLAVWQAEYGTAAAPSPSVTGVPEPSSLLLGLLTLVSGLLGQRRVRVRARA